MKNLNFAPNENFSKAFESFYVLVQPWNYFSLRSIDLLKQHIAQLFFTRKTNIFCFLSARSALRIFLKSLNLPANSEVMVLGFTCEAVVLPVLASNLKPIYVDVEDRTLSFDVDDFTKKLTNQTRVIILQHTFGMTPISRGQILKVAQQKKIIVVEDLAHGFHVSILSELNTKKTIQLLSFGRSKLLSVVHGGALIVPDQYNTDSLKKLYQKLNNPSIFFIIRALLYKIVTPFISVSYRFFIGKIIHKVLFFIGFFTQEVSLREKDGYYDDWLEKKLPGIFAQLLLRQVVRYKETELERISTANKISTLISKPFIVSSPLLRYPLLGPSYATVSSMLARKNILAGSWYRQPVAPIGLDLDKVQYIVGSCPNAEYICNNISNLPLDLTTKQLQTISKVLNEL